MEGQAKSEWRCENQPEIHAGSTQGEVREREQTCRA